MRAVRAQLCPPDRRIVPEETIAAARQQEGNADLGIALHELNDRALLVEQAMLVLAHAIETLTVLRLEAGLDPVEIASGSLEQTIRHQDRPINIRFLQEESACPHVPEAQ